MPPGVPRPRVCALQPLRPGPPWTQATEGAGPSRLHGASSYLQTETGRSAVAVAKVAPGPQPPLPLHPQQPHPPSPHGFHFPSTHSPPTSHCLAISLWTNCKQHTVTSPWVPFSSLPPGPHQSGLLIAVAPSHPCPAHPGLPKAHSHSSQFLFMLGKSPTPMAATILPVLARR